MYMNNNPYLPYQPSKQGNGILWVQGEAGAKSFIVGAGQTVLLMDSEADRFYIKSADASGMPMLRTFAFTENTPVNAPKNDFSGEADKYITRDELRAEIEKLKGELKDEQSVSNNERK